MQELQLNHQVIVLAETANLELMFADVHCLLKALDVLFGEIEPRFGKLGVVKESGNLERKTAPVIRHQRARLRGDIFLRLKAVMALSAAFNQVAEADVAFRVVLADIRLVDSPEYRSGFW